VPVCVCAGWYNAAVTPTVAMVGRNDGCSSRGGRCQSTHKHELPKLSHAALQQLLLEQQQQPQQPQQQQQEEAEERAGTYGRGDERGEEDYQGRRINLTFRCFA
jgi:hypothetical protein